MLAAWCAYVLTVEKHDSSQLSTQAAECDKKAAGKQHPYLFSGKTKHAAGCAEH